MNKVALIIATILFVTHGYSQNKFEREYRLDENTIPQIAVEFVDQLGEELKVKWYGEESQDGKSIEAKVKFKSRLHSIEFDTLGQLQDVEITVRESYLPKSILANINSRLKADYDSFSLNKIQIQYVGEPQEVLEIIKGSTNTHSVEKNYEIIVKGKGDTGVHLYEVTFNEAGELTKKSKIVFKNSDHLEY